jgi:hypothetical protein
MLISTLKYIDQEFYKKEIILKLRLYSDFIHFKLQYNFYYLNKWLVVKLDPVQCDRNNLQI